MSLPSAQLPLTDTLQVPGSTDFIHNRLKDAYRNLITMAGEDPDRDGLIKTPERAAKAWQSLTSGYREDPVSILMSAVFEEEYHDLVMVNHIEFYSLREHHLLPFYGKVHIAYMPAGKIVGLSKLPRIVDVFARRLQVQERLTQQLAELLETTLQPQGTAVIIDADHMCMMMRGVEKQHARTRTSVMRGAFRTDAALRETVLRAVR
jgi:GTP cyclohydrolase I